MKRILASSIFTRPANTTAYAAGDLVANNATAGSVTPLQFELIPSGKPGFALLQRARILKTGTAVVNPSFRLHLYQSSPTPVTNGDNGALVSARAGYLGSIDVTADRAFTDGAGGSSTGDANISVKIGKGAKRVFGLLEARGAYTPASAEQFTVQLEGQYEEE